MTLRRLIYKAMIVSPVLLIASIGVKARFATDLYEPTGYSPMIQQRLLAYREIVAETKMHRSETKPTACLDLAGKWLEGYRTGKLLPVYPASLDDSPQEGARGEVFSAVKELSETMYRQARKSAQRGDLGQAKNLLLACMEIDEVIKYSDFSSLNLARLDQTHALKRLNTLPVRNLADRRHVESRLRALLTDQRSLETITVVERRQFADKNARSGLEPVTIEDPLADASGAGLGKARVFLASQSDSLPDVYSAIRLGYQNQEHFKVVLQTSIAQWSGPLPEPTVQ